MEGRCEFYSSSSYSYDNYYTEVSSSEIVTLMMIMGFVIRH